MTTNYKLTPENVAHIIAAVKNDDTEEFDEDEDEDNPDDENPFSNMYPHMDILHAEPNGNDAKTGTMRMTLTYMVSIIPITCHHMFKPIYLDPLFDVIYVIYKYFIILTQALLRNKMKMSSEKQPFTPNRSANKKR
jgi:hypothetical protein